MDYQKLFREIQEGDWHGAYLFFGEEQYIKRQALDSAVEALTDPSTKDLNYLQLEGNQATLDSVINACETLPFLSAKRLVLIKDPIFINDGTGGGIDEVGFVKYLEDIPLTTCLILYNRGVIDKRKRVYRHMNKAGKALEFKYLMDRELRTWINQTLGKSDKSISYKAVSHLIGMIGNNLEDISNELTKLVSYIGQKKEIDIKAIEAVVTPNLEQSIFQLVDAIGEKKGGKALSVLDNLIEDRGQPIQPILAMIARQFRLILQCKGFYESGYKPDSIAQRLNQRLFVVRKCLYQGKNFLTEELKKGLELCSEVDYRIKTGGVQDRVGIELIIIKMCE
ncbi:MAG: DNA polymerase III subunit delta [Clostridiales bacterium]|nr:DNA polymerase III subunit delta [Clostridiales bacterium]